MHSKPCSAPEIFQNRYLRTEDVAVFLRLDNSIIINTASNSKGKISHDAREVLGFRAFELGHDNGGFFEVLGPHHVGWDEELVDACVVGGSEGGAYHAVLLGWVAEAVAVGNMN